MYELSNLRAATWAMALAAAMGLVDELSAAAGDAPDQEKKIGDLNVAIWLPADNTEFRPLVLFSHGIRGCKTQSNYLMRALADADFLVVAPDHADRAIFCPNRLPGLDDLPPSFLRQAVSGGSEFYADRRKDIKNLRMALEADTILSPLIDWKRVALLGHSLGGYSVLGLAGAWSGRWQMEGINAVVALAPFVQPFMNGGSLTDITVPVLLQVGSDDEWITPAVESLDVYDAVPSSSCMITYQGADHFAWTDHRTEFQSATAAATIAFLGEVLSNRIPSAELLASPEAARIDCK